MKSAAKRVTKTAGKRVTRAAAKKPAAKKTAMTAKAVRTETQVIKSLDSRTRRAVKALFELKGYL